MRPGGRLFFNISNRYFDLEPVLAAQAQSFGIACYVSQYRLSAADQERGAFPSDWVVMTRNPRAIAAYANDARWRVARARPRLPQWTDDYSSLLRLWMSD